MSTPEWKKQFAVRYSLCFFKGTDQEIIDILATKPNKSDYIRQLIKEDIERNGKQVSTQKAE